ncbi:hypothetical protein VNO77_09306 [Canavalia gladiata]|uniref:Uncharacterized protein n=1 Tax=Canavalia gladiata TaxID=3824 RepID=A0AAN9MFS4_CANGL
MYEMRFAHPRMYGVKVLCVPSEFMKRREKTQSLPTMILLLLLPWIYVIVTSQQHLQNGDQSSLRNGVVGHPCLSQRLQIEDDAHHRLRNE